MTRVLPTGWEKLQVQDVSKIYLGLTHTPRYIDNGIPFLSVKNISAGKIDFKDTKFISKEEFNSLPDGAKPQKGDVLFARVGTLGCPSIVDTEQPFGTFVSLGFFRVNKNKILNTYIRYWMMSPSFWEQVNINVQGSTLKNLNTGWLKNFEINVPSLPEQKRIVEKLDKIFANIDKAKEQTTQNLKNAQEVFESYANSLLFNIKNSIKTTIGKECSLMTGGTPNSKNELYYKNGNIKWLVSGDVHQGIIYDCVGRITEMGYNNSNAKFLPVDSVLIALNGQGKTRGTVALLKTKATCNQSIVSIKPNDDNKLLAEFLYKNLQARYMEIRRMTSDDGNDRRGLNMPLIRSIRIEIPSNIQEQKKIVKKLNCLQEKTKTLEQIYTKKLADLDELKQSILQQAFSGKL